MAGVRDGMRPAEDHGFSIARVFGAGQAARPGFEPGTSAPKADVLPLHHRAFGRDGWSAYAHIPHPRSQGLPSGIRRSRMRAGRPRSRYGVDSRLRGNDEMEGVRGDVNALDSSAALRALGMTGKGERARNQCGLAKATL